MFMPAAIILLVLLTTTAGAAQKTGTNQTAVAKASVLTLKTDQIDEIVDISTFLRNTRGEVFLFSRARGKIFKFKPDGTFDQSFCRFGEGPGEIARVFSMFHNPANDFLYLPEYYSNRGKINAYDSCGKFQGLMNVELSLQKKDHVWQILFLKVGTFFIITQIRINWKPEGKFFITQDEYKIDYFDKDGRLLAEIFKTTLDQCISNATGFGGPAIFFRPMILTSLTPEGHIALAKNDENIVTIYNRQGKAIETVILEIDREKLSDDRFNNTKAMWLEEWKGKQDERMLSLVKNMIKLDFQPIYYGFYQAGNNIILTKPQEVDNSGYIKKSKLIFFDKKGKKEREKIIDGDVTRIENKSLFIVSFDSEGNEFFRIEEDASGI
jgi:hypothetical protein